MKQVTLAAVVERWTNSETRPKLWKGKLIGIIGYSRDPDPRSYNARYRDWAPVWLCLPDGRCFITEAWVLS